MGKRYLLDTNIVIYYLEGVLTSPGKQLVEEALADGAIISIISKIELLGWNPPKGSEIRVIQKFVESATILDLDEYVANQTIQLRKIRKIKVPDAIIAATCLCYNLKLITRNTADFSFIKELTITNPFEL